MTIERSTHGCVEREGTGNCRAASRLHNAELALHDARQTGVDAWIAAAADRLHEAVVSYTHVQGSLENSVSSPGRTRSAA
jgi:hypothetical protein